MSDEIVNKSLHLIPKINFSAKLINKKNNTTQKIEDKWEAIK